VANERVMSLRMDEDLAEIVDLIAAATGSTVSDIIRGAVRIHVNDIRKSQKFQDTVAAYLDRQRSLLLDASVAATDAGRAGAA
jgi:predicted transcriptional regulator